MNPHRFTPRRQLRRQLKAGTVTFANDFNGSHRTVTPMGSCKEVRHACSTQ